MKPDKEIENDRYKNINTTNMFIVADIDTTQELDTSSIHGISYKTKHARYDAQYATLEELQKE